jgi:hypothetical protein
VSRIEGNGKRSLRRPELSTVKGSSAPGRRRKRRQVLTTAFFILFFKCDVHYTQFS